MEIRAEEISQVIRSQIKDYEKKIEMSETGTILSVGDGIARVYGVENAMTMEMLEFPGGIYGLCLNLEEDNVGVAIMGDDTKIKEGDTVKRTGRIAEIPVGDAVLGRVIDLPVGLIRGNGEEHIVHHPNVVFRTGFALLLLGPLPEPGFLGQS